MIYQSLKGIIQTKLLCQLIRFSVPVTCFCMAAVISSMLVQQLIYNLGQDEKHEDFDCCDAGAYLLYNLKTGLKGI